MLVEPAAYRRRVRRVGSSRNLKVPVAIGRLFEGKGFAEVMQGYLKKKGFTDVMQGYLKECFLQNLEK